MTGSCHTQVKQLKQQLDLQQMQQQPAVETPLQGISTTLVETRVEGTPKTQSHDSNEITSSTEVESVDAILERASKLYGST